MTSFLIIIAIFFIPGLVWYICKIISEHVAEPTEVTTDQEYEDGFIGYGSDIDARKNLTTGVIEYKFYHSDVWNVSGGLAETFRTERQFS
jgi:hypothetical protein